MNDRFFPADENALLTEPQLANYLSVSPRTVRRMRQARQIPYYRIRGTIRYNRQQVDEYLLEHGAPFR
jgi:excisionase family DNA binding protein